VDANAFDRLTQSVARRGSRRGLARLLLSVPLLGGLGILLGEETEAGRRRRRRARHKHDRNRVRRNKKHERNKRKKPPQSQPQPLCAPRGCPAGACGSQQDGCGGTLACNCPACQTCSSGLCVPDASLSRTPCDGGAGATSVCCDGVCCAGCCDDSEACGACRVFVTSTVYDGNLGGLSGAAEHCRLRAVAGSLPGANLPGNYLPWLSDTTGSPATRFRCRQASCSTEGYVLRDGTTVVANDWADLTDGTIALAIDVDEAGTTVAPSLVWTSTNPFGGDTLAFSPNLCCDNWLDTVKNAVNGSTTAADFEWSNAGQASCAFGDRRLYCFQQA
jgi:hypothetical protein